MNPEHQLRDILHKAGPDRVWRPIHDADGALLSPGRGLPAPLLRAYVADIDFAGKSVIDLGCNFGFFSFLALERGAAAVLGIDSDPLAIAGCQALTRLKGLKNARFAAADFLDDPPEETADMVLLIDFIGRRTIAKNRLWAVLDAASRSAERELVLTMRPTYDLSDLPDANSAGLAARYGPLAVKGGVFRLAEVVAARLAPGFHQEPGPKNGQRGPSKAVFCFTRKKVT